MSDATSNLQELAERWYGEILNQNKTDRIDKTFDKEGILVFALGQRKRGAMGAWSYAGFLTDAFKDAQHEITRIAVDGDIANVDLVLTATHTGHFRTIEPTNTKIRFEVFARLTASDGRITSLYEAGDLYGLVYQLAGEEQKTLENPEQRIFPTLRSLDWEKSRAFYKQLGFEVQFEWRHGPDFPVYAGIVGRGVVMHISEHSGDCEPGGSIAIHVDDVNTVHAEITAAGVTADEPEDMPWGDRMFMLKDPDGNAISFFAPLK